MMNVGTMLRAVRMRALEPSLSVRIQSPLPYPPIWTFVMFNPPYI